MFRFLLLSVGACALFFLSCAVHKTKSAEQLNYFEGVIEYSVVYESLHPNISTEDFISKSPDTKILYFKNGNFVTESFQNETMTSRSWFDQNSNKIYIQKINSDTLYYYNSTNVDFIMEPFKVRNGDSILEYPTQKITLDLKGKDSTNYTTSKSQFVFHIATGLPIDPSWFKNYYEFDYNKIMTAAPGMILKEEDIIFGFRKLTKTATRIERKSVQLDLSVDSTKILVKI